MAVYLAVGNHDRGVARVGPAWGARDPPLWDIFFRKKYSKLGENAQILDRTWHQCITSFFTTARYSIYAAILQASPAPPCSLIRGFVFRLPLSSCLTCNVRLFIHKITFRSVKIVYFAFVN